MTTATAARFTVIKVTGENQADYAVSLCGQGLIAPPCGWGVYDTLMGIIEVYYPEERGGLVVNQKPAPVVYDLKLAAVKQAAWFNGQYLANPTFDYPA